MFRHPQYWPEVARTSVLIVSTHLFTSINNSFSLPAYSAIGARTASTAACPSNHGYCVNSSATALCRQLLSAVAIRMGKMIQRVGGPKASAIPYALRFHITTFRRSRRGLERDGYFFPCSRSLIILERPIYFPGVENYLYLLSANILDIVANDNIAEMSQCKFMPSNVKLPCQRLIVVQRPRSLDSPLLIGGSMHGADTTLLHGPLSTAP